MLCVCKSPAGDGTPSNKFAQGAGTPRRFLDHMQGECKNPTMAFAFALCMRPRAQKHRARLWGPGRVLRAFFQTSKRTTTEHSFVGVDSGGRGVVCMVCACGSAGVFIKHWRVLMHFAINCGIVFASGCVASAYVAVL